MTTNDSKVSALTDAESVEQWQHRYKKRNGFSSWVSCSERDAEEFSKMKDFEVRGLYAAPVSTGPEPLSAAVRGAMGASIPAAVAPAAPMDQGQAIAFIDQFEIVGENNYSRDATDEEKFVLQEFVLQLFDAGERGDLLAANTKAPVELVALFKEALSWGMTYGPVLVPEQWAAMRDSQSSNFAKRATPPAITSADAQFLVVSMDDDGEAHPTYCADEEAVRQAVKGCVFACDDLDADELSQLDGMTAVLLEEKFLNFEGDPGIHLYRLAAPAAANVQAPVALTDEQILKVLCGNDERPFHQPRGTRFVYNSYEDETDLREMVLDRARELIALAADALPAAQGDKS